MRFRGFKSLRSRLMFNFLLVLLVPLAAMALYGQIMARDLITAYAVERSASQVNLQAESVVSSLHQALGDALYLDALRSIELLSEQSSPELAAQWRNQAEQDFMVLLSVRPMYRALRYINDAGMEIVSVHSDGRTVTPSGQAYDRREMTYFRSAVSLLPGGVYVSSFTTDQQSDATGAPLIHFTMRSSDEGLIVIDLHAGWLLRNLPADEREGNWALMDQDGSYLVHPNYFDPAVVHDDLSPLLSGERGTLETDHSVYVYETIYPTASRTDLFWVLYREMPKSIIFADLTQFYLLFGGLLLGGALLALLLAYTLSQRLTRPIAALEHMAAAFGRDGTVPKPPKRLGLDEIASLTRAFCAMARELDRKRNQEHRLIERLIHAQEEERKLIAFDLHDGLIQQLVGARFYLTNCRERSEEDAQQGIARGCDALTEAIAEGRRIIEGLRPAVLDDLGLIAAIEELAQTMAQAAGWTLRLNLQAVTTEPDKSVAVTLFRITQEALNNARKHAHARKVRVDLRNHVGIGLTIEDDGEGFDLAAITNEVRGLGVTTMRERATLLGGTCVITSQPGKGTRVEVWVPNTVLSQISLETDAAGGAMTDNAG